VFIQLKYQAKLTLQEAIADMAMMYRTLLITVIERMQMAAIKDDSSGNGLYTSEGRSFACSRY